MENKVQIYVLKGDITERETDAIINTSNNMLILGSGLGGAIKAKGGDSILDECASYGTIPLGDAVLTSAGKLKTKWIIHTALSTFDGLIEGENITKSILSSLRLANSKGFKSIAIPDMSMGIVRFSPYEAAERIFYTLKEFIVNENKSLHLVEIVVWDIETLHIYQDVYRQIFTQDAT